MSSHTKSTAREEFADGSSYNPNIDTVTFGVTLPVKLAESMFAGKNSPSPALILNCLARSMETSRNLHVQSAIKTLFDWIYERSTSDERRGFPNWFESQ